MRVSNFVFVVERIFFLPKQVYTVADIALPSSHELQKFNETMFHYIFLFYKAHVSSTPAWHVSQKLDLAVLMCADKGAIRTVSRANCGGLRMHFLYASDNEILRAGIGSLTRICEGGVANRHKLGVWDKAKDA